MNGSGSTTGSVAPPTSYSWVMIYSNNKTTLCGGGGSNRTIYTNSSSPPTLFDTLYTDSALTINDIGLNEPDSS